MKSISHLATSSFLLLVVFGLHSSAHAERADKEKPTTVESDQMFYDDLKQTNIFKGNVSLTRGTLVIHAEQLTSRQDAEGYQSGTASGSPATLKQKSDSSSASEEIFTQASGAQIEYDDRSQHARITGNAVLQRLNGSNVTEEVRGHVIVYDAGNESYTVEAGKGAVTLNNPQGRVRVVIQPRDKNASGGAADKPAAAESKGSGSALKTAPGIRNPRPE